MSRLSAYTLCMSTMNWSTAPFVATKCLEQFKSYVRRIFSCLNRFFLFLMASLILYSDNVFSYKSDSLVYRFSFYYMHRFFQSMIFIYLKAEWSLEKKVDEFKCFFTFCFPQKNKHHDKTGNLVESFDNILYSIKIVILLFFVLFDFVIYLTLKLGTNIMLLFA
jgi:hypothetical protein